MIDIENKIIYFGYGDISVGSGWSSLICRGFKPPVEIGTELTDDFINDNNLEYVTDSIRISFDTIEEVISFKKLVEDIDGDTNNYFEYCGYTFDFSNYNKMSIEAVLVHIKRIISYHRRFIAC